MCKVPRFYRGIFLLIAINISSGNVCGDHEFRMHQIHSFIPNKNQST